VKIGGMGEQAIQVAHFELRRIAELPADVEILAVLPELPKDPPIAYVDRAGRPGEGVAVLEHRWYEALPAEWVPHPRPSSTIVGRCLYIHVRHRFCFRGAEDGAPLAVEGLDDFLGRFDGLRRQEKENKGKPVPHNSYGQWVDDDA
jgi:hypothetical protein